MEYQGGQQAHADVSPKAPSCPTEQMPMENNRWIQKGSNQDLEKEAAIEPLLLHLESAAMQYALKVESQPAEQFIRWQCRTL